MVYIILLNFKLNGGKMRIISIKNIKNKVMENMRTTAIKKYYNKVNEKHVRIISIIKMSN